MSHSPAGDRAPRLHYRSPGTLASDPSLSPSALFAHATGLADQANGRDVAFVVSETERDILLALARRPDLDPDTIEGICQVARGGDWSLRLALMRNITINHLDAVADLAGPDLVIGMLAYPDVFAEQIITLIGHAQDVVGTDWSHGLVQTARTAIGEARIDSILTDWITSGDNYRLSVAVRTPLLTATGWDLLLQRIADGDGDTWVSLSSLAQRPDLTPARGLALYRAAAADQWNYAVLADLARNPKCPTEVFTAMAGHRAAAVRQHALGSMLCPPEVRWEAARKHNPEALLIPRDPVGNRRPVGQDTPIPADVAHIVLDDLDAGRGWRGKKLTDATVQLVRDRIAHATTDRSIIARLLPTYLAAADSVTDGVAAFFEAASARHGWLDADTTTGQERRQDVVLTLLSEQDLGDARAYVVPYLVHPDQLRSAASDPAWEVRSAAAGHLLLPEDAAVRLATDPQVAVRLSLVYALAIPEVAALLLANDPDPEVRWSLITHGHAPQASWAALAADTHPQVKVSLIRAHQVPREAWPALATDADLDVRRAASTSTDLPGPAMATMSQDADEQIRATIAERVLALLNPEPAEADA